LISPAAKTAIRTLAGTAFAAGVVAVTVLSLLPQGAVPHMDVSDKAEHLMAYLCLALAGGVAFPERRASVALGLGLVALGIALEIGQAFAPDRYPSVADAIANSFGVIIGLTIARVLFARARRSA